MCEVWGVEGVRGVHGGQCEGGGEGGVQVCDAQLWQVGEGSGEGGGGERGVRGVQGGVLAEGRGLCAGGAGAVEEEGCELLYVEGGGVRDVQVWVWVRGREVRGEGRGEGG